MATIRAPFNFVPLAEEVFFPKWANQVSHDIPFSNGESGVIEFKITAESPVFVRNGHTKDDSTEKNDNYKSFSKTKDDKFFIPSTSIKGCIRNVLEILSFGKMDSIDNKRYSIRDLQLKKYLEFFQTPELIHCGWLTFEGRKAIISDCGVPRRISHSVIDEKIETNFCDKFTDKDYLKNKSHRSAIHKYLLTKGKSLTGNFRELPLSSANPVDKRIRVVFDENGRGGEIVFTGQPSFRKHAERNAEGEIIKKAFGKFYEFVFLNSDSTKTFELDVDEENGIFKDFCFIYQDSEEWAYWKGRNKDNGDKIPVFFALDNNGSLLHFGLSYLYKLPYPKRIKEYLSSEHKKADHDLADCIFGYIGKNDSLKGRVFFSHAFMQNGDEYSSTIYPYMGSPKPTYYPMYLKQGGENGDMKKDGKGVPFSTMLDHSAILKGWKRYPVRDNWQTVFDVPDNQLENTSPFIPVASGAEFKCYLRYHNLRPEELGALLYSIELRKNCFHSIGFGKSLGYGRCKFEIVGFTGKDEYIESFKNLMEENITDYSKTPQITEFFAMSRVQRLNNSLEYMTLPEFVDCKRQHFKDDKNQTFGEYLRPYSEYVVRDNVPSNAQKELQSESFAVVVCYKTIRQARLENNKNTQNLPLVNNSKDKLKVGDRIVVEIKYNNKGKIDELVYKSKA